jgi:serine/threonine protein kinase
MKRPNLHYDHGVDIWAVGIMLYKLCTGWTPFDGLDADGEYISETDLCMNILKAPVDFKHEAFGWAEGDELVSAPDSVQNFIELCLEKEASARPKAFQLLEHPWI